MKDSEFLELLNLYLDHEISAADAARLEAEVRSNAARLKLYREYCRMQKACKILAVDFTPEVEPSKTNPLSGKVVAFDTRSRGLIRVVGYSVAGAAAIAAAFVAVMFVGREQSLAPSGTAPLAVHQAQPVAASVATEIAERHVERRRDAVLVGGPALFDGSQDRNQRARTSMVSDSLVLSVSGQTESVLAGVGQPMDDQLAWVRNFQMVSLQERKQIELLRFEAAPTMIRPEGRQLGGRAPAEASVEMTGFRFVK